MRSEMSQEIKNEMSNAIKSEMKSKMKFYLRKPYRVIGFADAPFCLLNTENGKRQTLPPFDFGILKECCTGYDPDEKIKESKEKKSKEKKSKEKKSKEKKSSCDNSADNELFEIKLSEQKKITECIEKYKTLGVIGNIQEYDPPQEYEYLGYVSRTDIQIAITARCNYHCRHCLAASGTFNESDELSADLCDRILKEAYECNIRNVMLTGGEPLLHPDFLRIVESIGKHGLKLTQILTNGSLITEDILDRIESLGQKPMFTISFDGIGTHDWMRNVNGAEESALAAFRLLKSRGFKTQANINVNNVTLPRITETCRMLVRQYGVCRLHPILTSPVPRWEQMSRPEESLSYGDYFDAMLGLIKMASEEKWNVPLDIFLMPGLHNMDRPIVKYLEAPDTPTGRELLFDSCQKASNIVFVGHDGRVLPCSAYEGITNAMGIMQGDDLDVHTLGLKKIFTESSYLEPYRTTVAELREYNEKCRDCRWAGVCRGGCRAFALHDCKHAHCHLGVCEASCVFFWEGYAEKYLEIIESRILKG